MATAPTRMQLVSLHIRNVPGGNGGVVGMFSNNEPKIFPSAVKKLMYLSFVTVLCFSFPFFSFYFTLKVYPVPIRHGVKDVTCFGNKD